MLLLTNFIKIEGEIAWQGAVETGFEKRSPTVRPAVRTSLVVLADTSNTGIHRLMFQLSIVVVIARCQVMILLYYTLPQLMYSTAVSRKKK